MIKSVIPTLRVSDSNRVHEMHSDGVSVFLSEHEGDGPLGTTIYLVVEDADELFSRVLSFERIELIEPYDSDWGHRVFEIQDEDENTIKGWVYPGLNFWKESYFQ